MKTFFNIYFLLFTVLTLTAQVVERPIETFYEPTQPKHVYYKDVNNLLNKYVGTWVYDDGTHYFRIQFFKLTSIRETPPANTKITIYTDKIYGHYEYKLNGIEMYNVIDNEFVRSSMGSFTSDGFKVFFKEPSTNQCGRNIIGRVILNYSNTNGEEQLAWNRTDSYRDAMCHPYDTTPFQIPANMVLTKID